MPLTKIFHRRSSSQKDRKKSLTSDELSASDELSVNKSGELPAGKSPESCDSENKRKCSAGSEDAEEKKTSETQLDICDQDDESVQQSDSSRRSSDPDCREQNQNKARSFSLKETGIKQNPQRTRRRKCESESAAFSSTDDEGFEDKVIQLRERDLEKVIGQCVDRLIRESILTAVKSVKVDNVCEEVMKSLSRSASESSESSADPEVVQQKLHTDSVTEYVDLQMVHTFEDEKVEDEVLGDSEQHFKASEELSESCQNLDSSLQTQNKGESTTAKKGPDCQETKKLISVTKVVDRNKSCEISAIEKRENPKDSTGSDEHVELSECPDQNIKISADAQVDDNRPEMLIGSDKSEDAELCKTDVCEQTEEDKNCSTNSAPTKTVRCDEQKDATDCSSRQESDHIGKDGNGEFGESKDEADEAKSVSVDGYHADLEESVSLHSLASESSLDSAKDSKVSSRTISDDTVTSKGECDPGGQLEEDPRSQKEDEKVNKNLNVEADLMAMSGDDFSHLLTTSDPAVEDAGTIASDLGENLPKQKQPAEDEKKINWKVGYLHVKLPHKTRHKGLKAWKKRCVAIQPDEFADDESDPCLVLSVYSGDSSAAKKHSASFWKSVSCQRAVVYRSGSRTHPYAFTVADDRTPVIHLAADSEAIAQEWMAAARAILWPPSPVVQLEKMLNGREFEVSIIDNEFSYRAGLLGMYGYLSVTPKKLILMHPQQGYVIQEWYLNTVDKFQLMPQTRIEDVNKVLSMTTCSDSSTGRGDILIFCKEAVSLLQAVAATIHQILSHHSRQEGGKYQKELEEIGAWLAADTPATEDYYKVPPRQVKSLLDIPNFIFNKPLTSVATVTVPPGAAMDTQKSALDVPKANPTRASQDSGISSEAVSDDFLNSSTSSFVVGGGNFPGKSSDSELSDAYTPPRSPEVTPKKPNAHA